MQTNTRIYKISFARIYPLYVEKVQKKSRQISELDQVICWLTGYSNVQLHEQIKKQVTLEDFFNLAPNLNPNRSLITGMICGVRLEDIEDPMMREIRYMDKLVDELAKGRTMDKILRK